MNEKIIIVLMSIGFVIIFKEFIFNIIENFSERIFSEETSGGSGRTKIWNMYIKLTFFNIKNMLFGLGLANYEILQGFVQHNLYIEAISSKGLIGLAIYMYIYTYIYIDIYKYFKIIKTHIISTIPMMTICIGFMFLNGLHSDIGIMTIFLALFSINAFNYRANKILEAN